MPLMAPVIRCVLSPVLLPTTVLAPAASTVLAKMPPFASWMSSVPVGFTKTCPVPSDEFAVTPSPTCSVPPLMAVKPM